MESRDRQIAVRAIAVAVAIVVVMVVVRTCMSRREERAEVTPSATVSSSGKLCTVTTKPGGATVYALRDGERSAIGITPIDVDQGDYDLRIELDGHGAVELHVGDHAEPCRVHRDLLPTP